MMSVYVCSIKTHTERTRAAFLSLVALFLHIEFPDHSANELRQFRLCKCFSVVLKNVKAWFNFCSRPPPHEDKGVFLPRILILKVAKNFRETFFRGVELIRVEVM